MTGTCSVADCDRSAYCRDWCAKHYQRWKMHGSPDAYRPAAPSLEERFWAMVSVRGDHECWPWLGSLDEKGYGRFWDDRPRKAHTVAFELAYGPIPDSLEPDHQCRRRDCVNPWCLEAVTHRVNSQRAAYSRTECVKGHRLPTPGPNGRRVCRPCANERNRRYKARRRARS